MREDLEMSGPSSQAATRMSTGESMYRLIEELYPICRSITGNGMRQTLRRFQREIPLNIEEVPSGTKVFDWTVPPEWNIRDAYIKDASGKRLVDFGASNLHVVSYSIPVNRRMPLSELRPHLHWLADRPDWIPYRTSYFQENWGFCVTQRQLESLHDAEYEVVIDSTLEPGHLSYGELCIPGATNDEILVSCHACHPSLCNDNLSGMVVAAALAEHINYRPRRFTYRFLYVPGTIGAITWLARNQHATSRIRHGLVLSGVGDRSALSYKKSRRGNAEIDRAVICILRDSGHGYRVTEFSPHGSDERQFCSPGFNLPVGRLSRAPYGQFPEYHTSADNLDFVTPESLAETFTRCLAVFDLLENNRQYINLEPNGEPQLGKRGIYRAIGDAADAGDPGMAMLWTINLSDGTHTLLDIAERSGMKFAAILGAARLLAEHDLLREAHVSSGKVAIS
jgi:aminopeptidase-like protein